MTIDHEVVAEAARLQQQLIEMQAKHDAIKLPEEVLEQRRKLIANAFDRYKGIAT